MDITKKCPHCDTALEFMADGLRFTFKAHDDAFCFALTRERVRVLERALLEQREAYERRIARIERDWEQMLATHGLPSLKERRTAAEAEALVRMAQVVGPLGDIPIIADASMPPGTIEIRSGEQRARVTMPPTKRD
jgi:hypothetical protein